MNNPSGFRWNPAIANGTIYVGTVYHPMQAVDLQAHTVLWDYVDRSPVDGSSIMIGGNGSPTFDGASVFIPTFNNDLYAIDAAAGTLKWKFTTSNVPVNGEFTSPVAGNGLLFSTNSNGLVYALDETTGVIKWVYGSTQNNPAAAGNATLANGVLYAGSYYGNFCALNALTGALKWSFMTGGVVSSGPCVTDAKGKIFHPGVSGDHQ